MLKFIYKSLFVIVIFLIMGIICKSNEIYREKVHYYLYEDNLAFSNFRNIYNKYLGSVIPLEDISKNAYATFNENIKYTSVNNYLDGCVLKVSDSYLVPSMSSGIITYIGEKEDYGNTVIVMGDDGISIWYGNMGNVNYNLYDSINKGDFIGEVNGEKLYLLFFDGDNFLDYDKYIG